MANHPEDQLKLLQQRLDRLEDLIQALIQRTHALEKWAFPSSELQSSTGILHPPQIPLSRIEDAVSQEPHPTSAGREAAPQSSEEHEAIYAPAAPQQESLESAIGGNVLNKIGMVAILLGMSYFLKYAIENQWIGETGRVIIGILSGLGFLGWGEVLQRRNYRGYSITVQGGGIAILYFSIFAAFNFYSLLSQLPALFIMILITTTAVVISIRHDSLTLAIFATVGGFLTPSLLSSGRDNQVGLFCYIALLDLGVLSLAYFKNWRGLSLLSFLFTHLVSIAWTLNFYDERKLWRTEGFLTLFFLIFVVTSLLYSFTHRQRTTFWDLWLIAANGVLYFLWTYALFEAQYFHSLGLYAICLAIFYLGIGSFLLRRFSTDSNLSLVLLGLSLTFLTLVIPIQLEKNWISIGWTIEAFALCWVGFHFDNRNIRWGALVVVFLLTVRLLFFDNPSRGGLAGDDTFLVNGRGLTFVVSVLALFAMAHFYRRYSVGLDATEHWLTAGLVVLANFLILFFMTTEVSRYFERDYDLIGNRGLHREIRSRMQLAISGLWGLYSIILVSIGIIRRFRSIRIMAILLFAVTILKVFLSDLQQMERIYRIVASIGLGVLLLAVSMMYQKYRTRINELVLKP